MGTKSASDHLASLKSDPEVKDQYDLLAQEYKTLRERLMRRYASG